MNDPLSGSANGFGGSACAGVLVGAAEDTGAEETFGEVDVDVAGGVSGLSSLVSAERSP